MRLEHTLNVRLARDFDVPAGLVDIESIIAVRQARRGDQTRSLIFGSNMGIDNLKKLVSRRKGGRSNSKIIHLSRN
jgi:hypothetical protein